MESINSHVGTEDALLNEALVKMNGTEGADDAVAEALYVVIPMTIVYSIIFLFGVVGNVSTCIVIARNRHMHTATNYYLFSLAVSDMLLLVSGMPQEIYLLWSSSYVFGEPYCVFAGIVSETCANATVLTITAFTVERYVAICHPFLSHSVTKLSRAVKFILAIWLFALCLALPQAIQFGLTSEVVGEDGNGTQVEVTLCTLKMSDSMMQHTFNISTFLFFVTPMTVITVLYLLIGFKLRRARLVKRPSLTGLPDRNHARSQKNVIRMLVAVVVAFFICWAPFHAQRLLAVYSNYMNINSPIITDIFIALTYISGILYYLSTAINPLLYNIMSHKFREAFKRMQYCGSSSSVTSLMRSEEGSSIRSQRYTIQSSISTTMTVNPETKNGGYTSIRMQVHPGSAVRSSEQGERPDPDLQHALPCQHPDSNSEPPGGDSGTEPRREAVETEVRSRAAHTQGEHHQQLEPSGSGRSRVHWDRTRPVHGPAQQ